MDVNRVLLDILVVLLAAKVAAEVADRVRVPAVVGEIVAGVIIGPSVLGWVHTSEALQTLAQLGVILLLLEVGLEMDLGELGSVGRAALAVACVGVIVPLVAGWAVGLALGMSGKEAVFVGAALTATSVGITARVFGDLRALASVEARTVLGAAVADDILGLVILTVVTRIVTQGSVSALGIAWVVVVAVGFVVLSTLIGVRFAPPVFALVRRHSRSSGTLVAIAFAFALAVSELAHAAQLAPIVGAFVAGIALARSSSAQTVRRELVPVAHLLVPVFFLQIGIEADVGQFARPAVFGVAAALFGVAVVGKLCSVLGLLGSPGDRLLVGIGMIPRGEVGLIFATLGLQQHVFGQDIYAALLLVVLVSTVATPPALRWRLLSLRARLRSSSSAASNVGVALVRVRETGTVELDAEPLPCDALVVALRAARLCAGHPAGASLMEWLGAFPTGPRRWDDRSREEFLALLRDGDARSWRLLIAPGVLQRCLPELDDALASEGGDAFDLDPLAALRFPWLSGVQDTLSATPDTPNAASVLLSGLVLDACGGPSPTAIVVARRTVQRLDLGARVEELVAGLVGDAELLTAAARRMDALSEESVLQLAVHLSTATQADALYLLSRATPDQTATDLDRLRTLYELVRGALAQPELVGREASNELERRRAQAEQLVTQDAVRDRIATAPRAYVLTQQPVDLARQAALCEPPPKRDDVRAYLAVDGDSVRIEIAARDRVGLLAHTTRVLHEIGCSIIQASVATWDDAIALASYRVRPPTFPDADQLRDALVASFTKPLTASPVADVTLTFDDASSPWYTRCTATGRDRPGLLHELTTAFAIAGVSVHAARITTDAQHASDVFDLTDPRGTKLDERAKTRVRDAVLNGIAPRRRRLGKRARHSTNPSPHLRSPPPEGATSP